MVFIIIFLFLILPILKFSGDQPQQELQASSGRAFIYFSSDLAMNLDGFNIVYEYNK